MGLKETLISNDAITFGILMTLLALIFWTSHLKSWSRFYIIFPPLLLCYLLPAILASFNIISEENSNLYEVSKDFLLPAALFLLTIGVDFKGLLKLGWRPIFMFLVGTLGVIIGGPIALFIVSIFQPELLQQTGNNELWRGLSTIAGSWIGGSANQTAMLEVFKYNPQKYGAMILVDIIVANIWMAILLFLIGKKKNIDKWLKADTSSIKVLKKKMKKYYKKVYKEATISDYMIILGVTFGVVGLSTYLSDLIVNWMSQFPEVKNPMSLLFSLNSNFFWLVTIVTIIAIILSTTKMREFEGLGASKIGSIFIYILVTTIGMKINIFEVFNSPILFLIGIIWMIIHVSLLFIVAKLIKSPFFYIAVGSQANIGGAASAPVVASEFSRSLTSIGVLLAILGYAIGTYGALISAMIMKAIH